MKMKQQRLAQRRERELAVRAVTASLKTCDAPCPLCGRRMVAGDSLNVHHLIPRMFGGRETAVIHRVCHAKIHSVFTEAELAQEYHTFPRLRAHAEMVRFITWVRRQPTESMVKHARPRRLA